MPDPFTVEEPKQSLLDDEAPRRFGDPPAERGKLLAPIRDREGEDGERVIDWEGHRKVAKEALKLWRSQDARLEREIAQWKVNSARRRGVTNAKVRFDSIDDHWTAWFPRNPSPDTIPEPNKAATLCRRLRSLLFTDPPAPLVEPPSGEDSDEDAAEFSSRALQDLQGESGLRTVQKAENAFDFASDFGSGFVRYWVHPRGGGRVPIEVEAGYDPVTGEQARHVDEALERTVQQPVTAPDPATGEPVPTGEAREIAVPWPRTETRFVRPDGTLTDEEGEAALRWAPALRSEALTARSVRPIPHTASDIGEATGVQVATFPTWGEVKRLAPELAQISKDARKKFFSYRPEKAKELFPEIDFEASTKGNDDERRVFVLITHYLESEADGYPDGLELMTVADQFVLHRGDWIYEDEETGTRERLELPVSQFSQWTEGRETFYKVGTMELVGGGNEARAAQIAALLDHLEKVNNRKIFYPTNSIVDPKVFRLPRQTAIPINPGGEPYYEDIPRYPEASITLYEIMSHEMDSASGLEGAAEALSSPSVESGRHAYAIISQVHAGLSEPRQGIERGYTRCCRIELQLARAFLRQPMRLKWTGDDGRYKEERWTGSDLVRTTDVRVKPGTLTMLSPAAKAQFVEYLYAQLQLVGPDEAREMLTTNIGGFIGLQDDPFRMRIRRQLAEWEDGPPEDWQPPPPQIVATDPATGQQVPVGPEQAQALQAQGIPVQEMPQPGPVAMELFDPNPADEHPQAAPMRLMELAKYMAGTRFRRAPEEWQELVVMEYQRMRGVVQMLQAPALPPAGEDGGEGTESPDQEPPGESVGPEGIPIDAVQEGVPPEMAGL